MFTTSLAFTYIPYFPAPSTSGFLLLSFSVTLIAFPSFFFSCCLLLSPALCYLSYFRTFSLFLLPCFHYLFPSDTLAVPASFYFHLFSNPFHFRWTLLSTNRLDIEKIMFSVFASHFQRRNEQALIHLL